MAVQLLLRNAQPSSFPPEVNAAFTQIWITATMSREDDRHTSRALAVGPGIIGR